MQLISVFSLYTGIWYVLLSITTYSYSSFLYRIPVQLPYNHFLFQTLPKRTGFRYVFLPIGAYSQLFLSVPNFSTTFLQSLPVFNFPMMYRIPVHFSTGFFNKKETRIHFPDFFFLWLYSIPSNNCSYSIQTFGNIYKANCSLFSSVITFFN